MKTTVNKISQILEREKWEVKALGEISEKIFSGAGVESKDRDSGDFPAMKTVDLRSINGVFFDKCSMFINPELVKKGKTFSYGDILVIGQNGSKELVGRSYLYLGKETCAVGGAIHVIRHNQNPKWLIYAINALGAKKQILQTSEEKHVEGMANRINISDLRNIKIPLPPRHIQDLIADILDSLDSQLTSLESSIKEIMETRASQYSFCAEKLLSRSNS